jgi:hypothetical protein
MRILYFLAGLILLFISFAPLKHKYQEYLVQQNGKLVEVRITKLRPSNGCKILYFFEFEYGDNQYSKRAGCNFHESHKIGQVIKLKHTEGSEIFLFPEEELGSEFVAFGLLGLFALFILIKAVKGSA